MKLTGIDPGFDPSGVLSFELVVPGDSTAERKLEVAETLVARLEDDPRVTSAGLRGLPPLSAGIIIIHCDVADSGRQDSGRDDGRAADADAGRAHADAPSEPGLSARVGCAPRRRASGSTSAQAPAPAVLVSRPYADHYFPNGNAVGATLTVLGGRRRRISVVTIAGVVDDIHLGNLEQAAERVVFLDPRQSLGAQRTPRRRRPTGSS